MAAITGDPYSAAATVLASLVGGTKKPKTESYQLGLDPRRQIDLNSLLQQIMTQSGEYSPEMKKALVGQSMAPVMAQEQNQIASMNRTAGGMGGGGAAQNNSMLRSLLGARLSALGGITGAVNLQSAQSGIDQPAKALAAVYPYLGANAYRENLRADEGGSGVTSGQTIGAMQNYATQTGYASGNTGDPTSYNKNANDPYAALKQSLTKLRNGRNPYYAVA